RRERGDVAAVVDDAAVGRTQELGEQVEDRGLAGAVRPDQRVDRAAPHPQVDAADRDEAREFHPEIVGFEDDVVSHDATDPVWTRLLLARPGRTRTAYCRRGPRVWSSGGSKGRRHACPSTVAILPRRTRTHPSGRAPPVNTASARRYL